MNPNSMQVEQHQLFIQVDAILLLMIGARDEPYSSDQARAYARILDTQFLVSGI